MAKYKAVLLNNAIVRNEYQFAHRNLLEFRTSKGTFTHLLLLV